MTDSASEDIAMAADQMMGEATETSEAGVVCLPEELGIAQVEACYTQLVEALSSASEVKIDASALKQVDTAGVQLLYAFVQEAGKKGTAVSWAAKSEELESVSVQLGVAEGMDF